MDELDLVLEQYSEPLTEETPTVETPGQAVTSEGTPLENLASTKAPSQDNVKPEPSYGDRPYNASTWSTDPRNGDLNYFQSGPKIGQRRKRKPKAFINMNVPDETLSGAVIDGALFLMLIDLLVPFLIQVLNNRFSDTKIKDSDLQLTSEQKKKLEPLADRVVSMMSMKANPVVLLTLAMTGIYGLNFMAAKMNNE